VSCWRSGAQDLHAAHNAEPALLALLTRLIGQLLLNLL